MFCICKYSEGINTKLYLHIKQSIDLEKDHFLSWLYRVYQKKVDKSEIALCFAKRLNIRCFFIKRDCFGTYNLE